MLIIYPLNYLLHTGLMLTNSKMFKFLSKLFFQMSAQVYSVPGQIEGRSKIFLESKSIDLACIIKVFINLFMLVRIGNILAILKIIQ